MAALLRVVVLFAGLAGSAFGQGYPARPVKLIVPFPPGGNTGYRRPTDRSEADRQHGPAGLRREPRRRRRHDRRRGRGEVGAGRLYAFLRHHRHASSGAQLSSWFGLAAPAGTPTDVVVRLNAEVLKALSTQDAIQTLGKLGLEPSGSSPQQYGSMIVDDLARWRQAVKAAGIKLE
jgi:hypothetical protein